MKKMLGVILKIVGLTLAMAIIYTISSAIFAGAATEATDPADAQLALVGILLVSLVDVIVLASIVALTHWRGVRLVLLLAFSFFGVHTVIGQIEALAFLTPLAAWIGGGSVPITEMPVDLIVGMFPTGFILAVTVVPLVAWAFGKLRRDPTAEPASRFPHMELGEWILKLLAIIVIYQLLYFGFGYYVAWQSEAVRTFYRGADIPVSFFDQLATVVSQTPALFGLQAVRALMWVGFVLPVIVMLRKRGWIGAIAIALFVALPMNMGHIIPNAFMPTDVRMVHFVETASSNLILGLVLFWLFHKGHSSLADLFGVSQDEALPARSTRLEERREHGS